MAKIYDITALLPGNYLQYSCDSTRQLFTILLDQYPANIYNITGLVSGNYLQ